MPHDQVVGTNISLKCKKNIDNVSFDTKDIVADVRCLSNDAYVPPVHICLWNDYHVLKYHNMITPSSIRFVVDFYQKASAGSICWKICRIAVCG